jgi:(S)-2-hydroxyglutarate dehydrogenase
LTGSRTTDFAIVGAGIIGLALARELRRTYPTARIIVLEKESGLGHHASGRNSGVLHSGVYYAAGSMKSRICAQGAKELAAFCDEERLPIDRCGKVIVPTTAEEDVQLHELLLRATNNGARAELIGERQLATIEPEARSFSGRALHCIDTAVVDPKAILQRLSESLRADGVQILLEHSVRQMDAGTGTLHVNGVRISCGHVFNAAGLDADRVARAFGAGTRYEILPFKGLYRRLRPESGLRIRGLIYPVPDLKIPFLGIHFTCAVGGEIFVGPTAIPALGRENYVGLRGVSLREAVTISSRVVGQYLRNSQGFRRYANAEALRVTKSAFVRAAQRLVPRLRAHDLTSTAKVGIRAQLVDRTTHELVLDFVVESLERSTHVLNAVSPGFTSAFPFARAILDGSRLMSDPTIMEGQPV